MNAEIIEDMRYMAYAAEPQNRAFWLEQLRVFCSALIESGFYSGGPIDAKSTS